MQTVAVIDGVEFVDDSLSTNVLPTIAAIDAFAGHRVALLVGGFDRGIDYRPLAVRLAEQHEPLVVLTLPDSGPRIHAALDEAGSTHEVYDCASLRAAVTRAFAWARPDGVVLLSPAAPSFGQFRDYRDRAAAFRDAIAVLHTAAP
jgi:UDP-N-acetylmuramoylalanine--D-glutamate ligase